MALEAYERNLASFGEKHLRTAACFKLLAEIEDAREAAEPGQGHRRKSRAMTGEAGSAVATHFNRGLRRSHRQAVLSWERRKPRFPIRQSNLRNAYDASPISFNSSA